MPDGPYEGRNGDWGMWKEGLQKGVEKTFIWDEDGYRAYLFEARVFFHEDCVIDAYRC